MYKLLIVEDEVWEREGLVGFLDWSALNIEIVGTAVNGIQALQMAKQYHPDILMTDIRMPIMDGLRLSREVRCFLPDCRIIIITGYDDFQYAKEAIEVGASDFLLKPVQRKQLLDIMMKTVKGIHRKNQQEAYVNMLKDHLSQRSYEEREHFLLRILQRNAQHQKAAPDELEFFLSCQKMAAVVLLVDGYAYHNEENCRWKKEQVRTVYKIIREVVGDYGLTAAKDMDRGEFVIGLPIRQEFRNDVNQILLLIQQALDGVNNLKYIIGVGSVSNALSNFAESFKHAQIATEQLFFIMDTNVLYYEDILCQGEVKEASVYDFLQTAPENSKKVLNGVISLDASKMAALLDELFNFIYDHRVGKSLICNYLADLVNELSVLLVSIGESFNSENHVGEDILKSFHKCLKLEELMTWVLRLLIYANACFAKKRICKEELIIDDVMRIINDEYADGIGLEVIAHRLGFSPNYLGDVFKKVQGKRFTEALTDCRMEKAKERIISSEDSIMDIAKAVGFCNASYFCTVFKKMHGISPMEFREKHGYEKRKEE